MVMVGQTVRMLVVGAVVGIVVATGSGASAQTDPATSVPVETTTTVAATTTVPPATTTTVPATTTTEPETIAVATDGAGFEGMVPAPDLRGGNAPTLMEKYPPSAYTWDSDYGSGDKIDGTAIVGTFAKLAITGVVGWGVIVTRVVPWAFTVPEIGTRYINAIAGSEHRGTFLAIAVGIISATSVYFVVLAFRNRLVEAVSHAGWMILLMVSTLTLMWAPGAIIGAVNRTTTGAQRTILSGMAVTNRSWDPNDGTTTTATFNGAPADDAIRHTMDVWWRMFPFAAWSWGETGNGDPKVAELILASRSVNPDNLTDVEKAFLASTPKEQKKTALGTSCFGRTGIDAVACGRGSGFADLRDQVLEKDPTMKAWVNGKNPFGRLAIAITVGFASLLSGGFMLGLALMTVVWTYMGIFRLIAWWWFSLAGMVPGKSRQRFVVYASVTVATFVKRIAAAWVLAFTMLVLTSISTVTTETRGGWAAMAFSQVAGTIVLIGLLVTHRKDNGFNLVPGPIRTVIRGASKAGITGFVQGAMTRRGTDQGGPAVADGPATTDSAVRPDRTIPEPGSAPPRAALAAGPVIRPMPGMRSLDAGTKARPMPTGDWRSKVIDVREVPPE